MECCRLEQILLVILIKEDELLSTHLFFLSVKLHGPGKYPALELQYRLTLCYLWRDWRLMGLKDKLNTTLKIYVTSDKKLFISDEKY